MISVLICSVNPDLLNNVRENIQHSIGVPFEILYFNNFKIGNGICKVYNELAAKAKFSILCFLHEDVILKTQGWGEKIIDLLKEPDAGLVGIAGSKYKSAYFSGWYTGIKEFDCANYTHFNGSESEKVMLPPDDNRSVEEVVCLDGVFICCKKATWKQILFDEKKLKGFHFYDIDFSVRAAFDYKILVSYEIEITHLTTGGDYSNNWVQTAISYHQSMQSRLPFSKIDISNKEADKKVIIATMDHLKHFKISVKNKIRWVILQNLFLKPFLYYHIVKFFCYEPLNLKRIHYYLKRR